MKKPYSYYDDCTNFAEICGYIGDKRFIKPLIELLNNFDKSLEDLKKSFEEEYSDEEDDWDVEKDSDVINLNYQRGKVLEALARMRIEPYYSDYIKKRTLTKEQIMDEKERLNFNIYDFVYVLGTQKAFLELSKYLLSNKPYQTISSDDGNYSLPVSESAFYLIRDNIENKDLQKMIKEVDIYDDDYDLATLEKPIYDWMQKNYGKYKIKRIW